MEVDLDYHLFFLWDWRWRALKVGRWRGRGRGWIGSKEFARTNAAKSRPVKCIYIDAKYTYAKFCNALAAVICAPSFSLSLTSANRNKKANTMSSSCLFFSLPPLLYPFSSLKRKNPGGLPIPGPIYSPHVLQCVNLVAHRPFYYLVPEIISSFF